MDIAGKAALITGGGSGIGRATALALAAKGARHIHLVDVNDAGSRETAELIGNAASTVHHCNVADLAALERVFDAAAAETGLDIVFNNAGIVTGANLFPHAPIERIREMTAINIDAVIQGTQLAVKHMDGKGGVVVNTGSMAATHPRYRDIMYSASKAAVVHFTACCFQLMEWNKVRVCGVNPGLVDTPIVHTTGGDRLADWMAPVIAGNVALHPSVLADAVVAQIEDDEAIGVTIDVRAPAPVPA